MGELVVRLGAEQYVRWSNTTDAPTSHVMDRDALIQLLQSEDQLSFEQARHLLDIASETGTSDAEIDVAALLADNRAGTNEERLSVEDILRQYEGPR